jgi:formylglycine-generating enzyme
MAIESVARTGEGMARVPGGEFVMGSADFYPEERPVRRVAVPSFYGPAARQFEAVGASTGHIGFRCVARDG